MDSGHLEPLWVDGSQSFPKSLADEVDQLNASDTDDEVSDNEDSDGDASLHVSSESEDSDDDA